MTQGKESGVVRQHTEVSEVFHPCGSDQYSANIDEAEHQVSKEP